MSDIERRDPRREWILRNRLHPLHESVAAQSSPAVYTGPSGLLRKNPHQVGFIGPNGIKRIDRLNLNGAGAQGGSRKAADAVEELPLIRIDNPQTYLLAVMTLAGGRLTSHDKDVLGQAHALAQDFTSESGAQEAAVVAVIFGECKETDLGLAGADRVIHFDGDEWQGYQPEQQVAALQALDKWLDPAFWLFADPAPGTNETGRRLAAALGERPAAQAWQVNGETCVCRGGSQLTDIERPTPRILLLMEECAAPVDETRHEAIQIDPPTLLPVSAAITDMGRLDVDPNSIALTEAEFILSAGNGIHDWDQYHEAARVLGATEGGSRVAVDDGFLPRFRQVGATGSWVTAQVYVALGISGAVQHLQGIGQVNKVVAVNTDPGCDMVKRADLTVIADTQEFLAALLDVAERERAAQKGDQDVA
ncbi:MAG: electron transfer flavoprotein subunit alpha [Oceanospirillaceae bacterium]|nr:electron transfer flavoprotein subunit alpha [Oceanospirillaceae bacterium]MBT11275.1 electron transfer flavoprotein subunit alpha [Oceanospirillaceae bacterium]|tara:strand:+ start:133371 stop:134633 length:1263 start_codon:yes stop_codon:yes gene_type:complete